MPPALSHAPRSSSVLVVDGYGISLTVHRGRLTISDGRGSARHERQLSRIDRTVRRLVILADTGNVSLEAVRWLADLGITLVQLDRHARVLLSTPPGPDDARLRRAQALARDSETGLTVARELLALKVGKQAAVLADVIDQPQLAAAVRSFRDRILQAKSIRDCVDAESHAASAYFGGWIGRIGIRFAARDADRVPDHWHEFATRSSIGDRGRSPRVAVTPVNALLNYLYALAEAECRIALVTLGLDPGLGIWHVDTKARDSLALDLLEIVRPDIDRWLLQLLARRTFRAAEFHETRTGQCRLMPPLTQELVETMPLWSREIAPVAERLTHLLADGTGRSHRLTPLTQGNRRPAVGPANGRRPRAESKAVTVTDTTCRNCGTPLGERRRKLCSTCWPVTRAALATERAASGAAIVAERRAQGDDPTNTPTAHQKRSAALSIRKREQLDWDATRPVSLEVDYDRDIHPRLAEVPLSRIAAATGLSISACSRIRSGGLRPHPRHWAALNELRP